eukprot:CAMPEP_0198264708 /NCGR_PEP_ID=MMETSP1447-20131203/16827_1 /TAXON_ID=420782 /ORGANISM="Chaetoceros dichaeta, Strain CCMP1751" /LENGTH=65 /DNA_ID=CAMNT_0043953751 /DNA_START=29 /DNA_END=223 /DNA_ORIENTATION=+
MSDDQQQDEEQKPLSTPSEEQPVYFQNTFQGYRVDGGWGDMNAGQVHHMMPNYDGSIHPGSMSRD